MQISFWLDFIVFDRMWRNNYTILDECCLFDLDGRVASRRAVWIDCNKAELNSPESIRTLGAT